MNEQLIDYLYGELSAEERQAFEAELKQDKALQEELRELTSTRAMLRHVDYQLPKSTVVELKTTPHITARQIKWLSMAAAIALLLLVGKPKLDIGKQGVSLAFGTPPTPQLPSIAANSPDLTADDYVAITRELVAQDQQRVDKRLDSLQQLLSGNSNIDAEWLEDAINQKLAGYKYQQNRQVVRAVDNKYEQNMPRIVSNMQDMQLEQRREVRRLLNQLWQQVQRQRESDLQAIEEMILDLQRQQMNAQLVDGQE
jgi:tellurite resistance protein